MTRGRDGSGDLTPRLERSGLHPADADLTAHLRGQVELELAQLVADELCRQRVGPNSGLLVREQRHGDDLVGAAGHRVVADEAWLTAQRLREAVVEDAHQVADEAGTDLVLTYGGVHASPWDREPRRFHGSSPNASASSVRTRVSGTEP